MLIFLPIGILGQVWYLIVSIPDLCTLTYYIILSTINFTDYRFYGLNFSHIQFLGLKFTDKRFLGLRLTD